MLLNALASSQVYAQHMNALRISSRQQYTHMADPSKSSASELYDLLTSLLPADLQKELHQLPRHPDLQCDRKIPIPPRTRSRYFGKARPSTPDTSEVLDTDLISQIYHRTNLEPKLEAKQTAALQDLALPRRGNRIAPYTEKGGSNDRASLLSDTGTSGAVQAIEPQSIEVPIPARTANPHDANNVHSTSEPNKLAGTDAQIDISLARMDPGRCQENRRQYDALISMLKSTNPKSETSPDQALSHPVASTTPSPPSGADTNTPEYSSSSDTTVEDGDPATKNPPIGSDRARPVAKTGYLSPAQARRRRSPMPRYRHLDQKKEAWRLDIHAAASKLSNISERSEPPSAQNSGPRTLEVPWSNQTPRNAPGLEQALVSTGDAEFLQNIGNGEEHTWAAVGYDASCQGETLDNGAVTEHDMAFNVDYVVQALGALDAGSPSIEGGDADEERQAAENITMTQEQEHHEASPTIAEPSEQWSPPEHPQNSHPREITTRLPSSMPCPDEENQPNPQSAANTPPIAGSNTTKPTHAAEDSKGEAAAAQAGVTFKKHLARPGRMHETSPSRKEGHISFGERWYTFMQDMRELVPQPVSTSSESGNTSSDVSDAMWE